MRFKQRGKQGRGSPVSAFDNVSIAPGGNSSVPEPASMLLVGLGLMGLAGVRRKMRK